jgi:hypothetical protein
VGDGVGGVSVSFGVGAAAAGSAVGSVVIDGIVVGDDVVVAVVVGGVAVAGAGVGEFDLGFGARAGLSDSSRLPQSRTMQSIEE